MSALDEAQILAEIRNGNGDAFAKIVEHYQTDIIRYLHRLTGDNHIAQDLAQDTFLNAYRGILKHDVHFSLRAWLYKIATNNARQYHRRNRILSFIPIGRFRRDDIEAHQISPDDMEEEIMVQDILLRIPNDQRHCMILHFVEGFKYKEIAEILGTTEDAIRMRVARGREVFKKEYGARAGGKVQ